MGSSDSREMLLSGLRDGNPNARLDAARQLLEEFRGPDDEDVRDSVAQTLAGLLVYKADPAIELLVGMGDEAGEPLLRMASEPTEFPIAGNPLLDNEDEALARSQALITLWRRAQRRGSPDEGAFESFVNALNDESVGVRWQALAGLEELADPRAVGPLKDFLNEESNGPNREEAAALIEKLG
jgi:hypothetical protein